MRSGKLWRGRLASPLRLPCKAVLLCRSGVKEVHAELKELPRTHAAITGPRQCAFTMLVAQTGKGNSALASIRQQTFHLAWWWWWWVHWGLGDD